MERKKKSFLKVREEMRVQVLAVLAVLLAATLWGLIGIMGKATFAAGISPLEVAFWRALIAGGLFFIQARVFKEPFPKGKDGMATVVFGILGVAVFYGGYQLAVRSGGVSLASVLLYTAPAFVAVMSVLVLKEKFTSQELMLVILTIFGVALLSWGGGSGIVVNAQSLFWGLLSGFTYALYYLFGKLFFYKYSASSLYSLAMPIGALVLLPFVDFHTKSLWTWCVLGAMGVFSTYVAYFVYSYGLKHLPAVQVSVIASLEPVVAGGFAYLFFKEQFSVMALLGGAVVLLAVVLSLRK